MAHEALPRFFVIRGNAVFFHPRAHGPRGFVGGGGANPAALHRNHPVTPPPVKAHCAVRPHRILGLVAVVKRVFRPQDFLGPQRKSPDAPKRVVHLLQLGLQLLGIGHVAIDAAAAFPEIRAVRLHPFR
ncbi:hypothetical protein SDC9_77759 [bioreactor metagenome]|uniref:Uncharacterized protein n=1 Tax=bioreactor metagenome TaxID=1076179 RepID=A0A644YRJ6_9ZZZZ